LIILGLKKATEEEIQEQRDVIMRSQYFDPIERFPERIDQLLDALNRVCSTLIIFYLLLMIVKIYMTQRTRRSTMRETTI
jgi:hypothetical protein